MATERSVLFSWGDVEGLPELRRLEGRRLRAGGAHPLGGFGPPGVHADALGQPVVEAQIRHQRPTNRRSFGRRRPETRRKTQQRNSLDIML